MSDPKTAFEIVELPGEGEFVVEVPEDIDYQFASGGERPGRMGHVVGPDGETFPLEEVATGDTDEHNAEGYRRLSWKPERCPAQDTGKRYRIVRFYRDERPADRREGGLTLAQAQAHCQQESTHELDDEGVTLWFDGYEEERP